MVFYTAFKIIAIISFFKNYVTKGACKHNFFSTQDAGLLNKSGRIDLQGAIIYPSETMNFQRYGTLTANFVFLMAIHLVPFTNRVYQVAQSDEKCLADMH